VPCEVFLFMKEYKTPQYCSFCKRKMKRVINWQGGLKVHGSNHEVLKGIKSYELANKALDDKAKNGMSKMETETAMGLLEDREKEKGLDPGTLTGRRKRPKTKKEKEASRKKARKKIIESRRARGQLWA